MNKVAPLLARLLTGPFGGTIEMASRKPWESLGKHLTLVQFRNLYLGGAYIAAGEKCVSLALRVATKVNLWKWTTRQITCKSTPLTLTLVIRFLPLRGVMTVTQDILWRCSVTNSGSALHSRFR
jgi:hypothetical protein